MDCITLPINLEITVLNREDFSCLLFGRQVTCCWNNLLLKMGQMNCVHVSSIPLLQWEPEATALAVDIYSADT